MCLGFGCILSDTVKAEGSPIYYDSFYEDYYKAFPDSNPQKAKKEKAKANENNNVVGNVTQANIVADPYVQTQVNGEYYISPVASYYQGGSVEHNPKNWEFESRWKKSYGHFMFETSEDSILNWDETDSKEYLFKMSKDFMLKNRQFVVTASYGKGDLKTSRTSDDDIYNSAHIISLGDGSANLKDWSVAIGARNLWKLGNWDVTPFLGYKKKEQDFEMANHATPSPFYLEADCQTTDAEPDVCHNTFSPAVDTVYEATKDADGNYNKVGAATGTVSFTGTVTLSDGSSYTNVAYGDQIYQEDFCYHTAGQDPNKFYCIEAGEEGANLIPVFGGVSSIFIQDGTTHMYYVDWTGPFIGLQLERKMSDKEDLVVYGEYFFPEYKVWGNWPNRDDWAHDPSFWDKGGKGYGLLFNVDYKYRIKSSIQLILGFNYEYIENKNATTQLFYADGSQSVTEDAVRLSQWKDYGFNIGVAFKL